MKKDKEKRKHHESTIGKIIYGFLLFLPLLAIGVSCGYAMFNKNAYQSYYGETINDYSLNEVSTINDVTFNSKYKFNNKTHLTYTNTGRLEIGINNLINNTDSNDLSNASYVALYNNQYQSNNNMFITFYDSNRSQIRAYNMVNEIVDFDFDILSYDYSNNNVLYYLNYLYKYNYNKNSFVSETFYYSINRVEESNLFNWAKTSMIYTGMLNFTTAMNVTNTFMPMLLTYWLIISVIYFLYDIVLIILVVLHRKIHELQESI